ncbi:MAG: DUF1638 domain-containing protein [Opitutales bacterium]|nr:DUF1638 domain-containing protein [Opitutales bacterium]
MPDSGEERAGVPAIIACDVFTDEFRALGGDAPLWTRIRWLEMGLHDRPDALRREVQAVIDEWDTAGDFDEIVLAYGLCGNGLLGIEALRKHLVLPRAHDCISMLLGGPRAHESLLKENPGPYFYSPGWIRHRRVPGPDRAAYLQEEYSRRYPDDPDIIGDLLEADALAFSHHNCAAYVDITKDAEAEAYCRDCARHMGWRFRRLAGDSRLLEGLLRGDRAPERFLVVPPGQRIARSGGEELIVAVPGGEGRAAP